MLQVWIDDSGRLNSSRVCVLGGYIAQAEQWAEFSEKWQAVLEEEPRVQYFKMSECMAALDEFEGFTYGERCYKLRQLVKLVPQYARAGIVATVPSEPYQRIFASLIEREYHRRPYHLLAHGLMAQFIRFALQEGINDRVEFYLDYQGDEPQAMKDIISEFQQFVAAAPPEAQALFSGLPKFENDDEFKPLQAADMLVWCARHSHEIEGALAGDIGTITQPLNDIPLYQDYWSEERLAQSAEFIRMQRLIRAGGTTLDLPQRLHIFERGDS
jgi:uncharacterized protein DUF3800